MKIPWFIKKKLIEVNFLAFITHLNKSYYQMVMHGNHLFQPDYLN